MGERIASFDWSKTPVGPLQDWPQSLRATVKTLVGSRYPMILLWSDSYIQIYNDAYTNLIGNKHPDALGRSIRDTQAESWETIGPMIRHVMTTGTPNWVPAQMLALTRSGYIEETYFSLSYSAVEDDNNNINGMLCVCSEVTQQVIGERRLKLQRDLSSKAGETRTVEKVCDDIMAAVSEYRSDVPFMQLYLIGADGKLNLKSYTGIDHAKIDRVSHDTSRIWSLEQAANGAVVVTKNVAAIIPGVGGPWDHPVNEAISIQIPSSTPGSHWVCWSPVSVPTVRWTKIIDRSMIFLPGKSPWPYAMHWLTKKNENGQRRLPNSTGRKQHSSVMSVTSFVPR